MIPNIPILEQEIEEVTYEDRTYKINFHTDIMRNTGVVNLTMTVNEDAVEGKDRISGYIDGIEAIIQAIYLILSTERYQFIIYSWDYGVELVDLFGKQMPYVMSELPRRIKDALTQDNRIEDVVDFEFETHKQKLHTTFNVITNLGDVSVEMEVAI